MRQTNRILLAVAVALLGVIGGGFELKEFKIPKIGGFSRLLAGFVGICLISLSMSLRPDLQPAKPVALRLNEGISPYTSENWTRP